MAIISLTNAAGRSKSVEFELNGRKFIWHKLKWGEVIRLQAARETEGGLRLELVRLLNDMKAAPKDKPVTAEWMDELLVDEVIALQNFINDPDSYDPKAPQENEGNDET